MAVSKTNAYYLVALVDVDGDNTGCTYILIGIEACLLDDTLLGSEYHVVALEELLVAEVLDAQNGIDRIVGLDVEHILDGATLRVLVALRNLVTLLPVAAALLCEEQQRVVHCGRIDILCEVVVAMTGCLRTHTATALLMEVAKWCALDVTHVRDGDDNRIIGIEVFGIELVVEWDNLCTTLVAILLLNLEQILLHNLLTTLGVIENLLQLGNELLQVVELLVELINTQTCELSQAHINDSL